MCSLFAIVLPAKLGWEDAKFKVLVVPSSIIAVVGESLLEGVLSTARFAPSACAAPKSKYPVESGYLILHEISFVLSSSLPLVTKVALPLIFICTWAKEPPLSFLKIL